MELDRKQFEHVKMVMEAQLKDSLITQFVSQSVLKAVEKKLDSLPPEPAEENKAVK